VGWFSAACEPRSWSMPIFDRNTWPRRSPRVRNTYGKWPFSCSASSGTRTVPCPSRSTRTSSRPWSVALMRRAWKYSGLARSSAWKASASSARRTSSGCRRACPLPAAQREGPVARHDAAPELGAPRGVLHRLEPDDLRLAVVHGAGLDGVGKALPLGERAAHRLFQHVVDPCLGERLVAGAARDGPA